MYQSPLVRTLQLLTQEEFETLHLFAASPIFNNVRPDETFALFEFLRRHYPTFEHPSLHRDAVAHQFFPKAANPVGALQRSMAQLMSIVRKFITFRYAVVRDEGEPGSAASLHEVQQKLALMRFYSERMHQQPAQQPLTKIPEETGRRGRKAENFFLNLNNQARTELDGQLDFSDFDEYEFADFHYFRFMVEWEKAIFENTSSQREGDKNLLAATEYLDQFYLLNKLEQMSQLMHHQRMSALYEKDSPEQQRFLANSQTTLQIAGLLRSQGFLQDPAISIYCTFLDFITQDDPAEAERLSEAFAQLLEQHVTALPKSRITNLKIMFRSYWPARYRQTKDRRFLEKIFSMQLQQLEQIGVEEGLPSSHFQNILITALKLGKSEWANDFFQKYEQRIIGLDADHKHILLDIARAAIFFGQKNWPAAAKALPHYLSYGALDDIYLYAIAATLDTRIHYEINDLDDDYALGMVRATTMHIKRDETLPPKRCTERIRFFSIAKELFKLKQQRQRDRKADIATGLSKIRHHLDHETVVDWEWLEEKYAEMEGK